MPKTRVSLMVSAWKRQRCASNLFTLLWYMLFQNHRHVLIWCQRQTCIVSEKDMCSYGVRDRHVPLWCQRQTCAPTVPKTRVSLMVSVWKSWRCASNLFTLLRYMLFQNHRFQHKYWQSATHAAATREGKLVENALSQGDYAESKVVAVLPSLCRLCGQ